jgi:hypothetical protein
VKHPPHHDGGGRSSRGFLSCAALIFERKLLYYSTTVVVRDCGEYSVDGRRCHCWQPQMAGAGTTRPSQITVTTKLKPARFTHQSDVAHKPFTREGEIACLGVL